MDPRPSQESISFGRFELDCREHVLRRDGRTLRLRPQAVRMLEILARQRGEIVSRGELRERIWGCDTYVDWEQGIKSGIRRVRAALGDDAIAPRYIRTVPGKGYKFIASTEPAEAPEVVLAVPADDAVAPRRRGGRRTSWIAAAILVVGAAGLLLGVQLRSAGGLPGHGLSGARGPRVVVGRFENLTGEPRLDDALGVAFRLSLQGPPAATAVEVLDSVELRSALRRMERPEGTAVDREVGLEICRRQGAGALVLGKVLKLSGAYLMSAEVVDPASGRTVIVEQARAGGDQEILPALEGLSEQLRRALTGAAPAVVPVPLEPVTTRSLEALETFSIGMRHFEAYRVEPAYSFFQRAVEVDPEFAMAHLKLAQISFPEGRRRHAARHIERARARRDRLTDAERLYVDGYVATLSEAPDAAIRHWQVVHSKFPGDALLSVQIGGIYFFGLNEFEKALESFERALELPSAPPLTALSHGMVGHCRVALGQLEAALESYGEFRDAAVGMLTPCDASLPLVALGRYAEAEDVLRACGSEAPGWLRAEAGRLRSLLEIERGDLEAALRAARESAQWGSQARNLEQTLAGRLYALAIREARGADLAGDLLREIDGALHLLEVESDASGVRDPVFSPVPYLALLGRMAVRARAVERAGELLERIRPRVGEGRSRVWRGHVELLHGEILIAAGDGAHAARRLEEAIHGPSGPSPLHLRESLARAYEAAGRLADARREYAELASRRSQALVECLGGVDVCWDRAFNVLAAKQARFQAERLARHRGDVSVLEPR